MATLTVVPGGYAFRGTFAENHFPKNAGFRWNPTARAWQTTDARCAARLVRFADGLTRLTIEAIVADLPPAADEGDPVTPIMTFDGGSYLYRSARTDNRHAKNAGFCWSKGQRAWLTEDVSQAAELIRFADDVARRAIETALVAADATIAASKATDADIAIPAPTGLEYLPFQKAGIAYCATRTDALIADEMGLGKTIQAIGAINLILEQAVRLRILVVAPKIVLINWTRELAKWLVKPLSVGIATTKAWPATDIVVVNYDILVKLRERLVAEEWDFIVFDEAHALKERSSKRTRAALGDRVEEWEPIPAKRRLFMTGTPVLNRPVELFPMLRAMGVPEAQDYIGFTRRYCAGQETGFGWDDRGASNLAELQSLLRRSVMVRRMKADVLTELPPKRWAVVELPPNTAMARAVAAEQKAIAEAEAAQKAAAAKKAMAEKAGDATVLKAAVAALKDCGRVAFELIPRLRHETALAKVPAVVEHVLGLMNGSEGAILLFAHHRDVIADIVAGLAKGGYEAAVITGDTSQDDRQTAQDDIQQGRKRIFVGSIRACGVGITLHAASTVVFAEQDWTPGIMAQAEDRAHRIGQANAVLVQHLVLDGSFDARMAKVVVAKAGVISDALDGATATMCDIDSADQQEAA